jgi:amino acid transporter
MVSFLVSGMVLSYAMGPIALLCMRLELPQQKRAFKLPFAYIICPLAFYFCNLLSYWTGWDTIYKLTIAMLVGLAVYAVTIWRARMTWQDTGLQTGLWVVPYFSGLVLISYLGSFGGKNIIPFGWDFLVIGIFSLTIMLIAIKNRARMTSTVAAESDQRMASLTVS